MASSEDSEEKPEARPKRRESSTATEPVRDRNRRVREEAAAKRRVEREPRARAKNLDTSELVDDALARSTHALATFLRKNFTWVQWIILGGIAVWIGLEIYGWRSRKATDKASDALISALHAEFGRVGSADLTPDPLTGLADARPAFPSPDVKNAEARRELEAIAADKSAGFTSSFARLELAGMLLDDSKYADAKQAYEDVRNSALAKRDGDVRSRALEGLGMSLEGLGQKDDALKLFRELENQDIPGFGALGLYHQARLRFAGGELGPAKELVQKAQEKLKKSDLANSLGYLTHSLNELLRAIDPKSAPAEAPGQMSQEKLQELLRQLQKNKAGHPAPIPAGK